MPRVSANSDLNIVRVLPVSNSAGKRGVLLALEWTITSNTGDGARNPGARRYRSWPSKVTVIKAASDQNEIAISGRGNVMDETVLETTPLNFCTDVAIIARMYQQLIALQQKPFPGESRKFLKAFFERIEFLRTRTGLALNGFYSLHCV